MSLMTDIREILAEELAAAGDVFVDCPDYPASWGKAERRKFLWAVEFAREAHKGVVRKGTAVPYVLHPVEAALIVLGMTADVEAVTAAVLHDIVEDTEYKQKDVKLLFGKRVADLVMAESEDKMADRPAEATWMLRKQATMRHLATGALPTGAKMICLGDKLSNIRMSVKTHAAKGDAMWESFHQSDPRLQKWYYSNIGEALSELKNYPAWQEYVACCAEVFDRVEDLPAV